ncbi:PepSY domain-containing protein [Acinetobacter sp. ME22]|uniref:PepSY-associated TM helix domain-containing protein n=1 Tax=Acinetobacter sp. ME22 TaxID=2904802 RepID=UPI001ED9ED51|nr:PepSY domain-containing protein [Acinetobacter sp. ME22]MCG2572638.1 PepSY domain-containing protein [Acinetobacter sp. ME22]
MQKNSSQTHFSNQLLHVLHVQLGVLVAPFIFIAALTGLLYALTPQIEHAVYQKQLFAVHDLSQSEQALSLQVAAAQKVLPKQAIITAVRPAPQPDATTRVLYLDPNDPEHSHAVFINPYTLAVQGQLPVYGTSGVLPIRTFLDNLHRNLLLGTFGRAYSELAASWLGIFALTGLWQWYRKRQQMKVSTAHARQKNLRWHAWIGLSVFPMLLFFSATGLTWSNWAGANIAKLRHLANSDTPTLNTQLSPMSMSMPMDAHAEHHMSMPMSVQQQPLILKNFDIIEKLAQQNGLTSEYLQIKPSYSSDKAWTIEEMHHRWPVQVDAIAVDMQQQKVVDQIEFAKFPLSAKLTRWGVDAHIGVLFGWVNQLVLVLSGALILGLVVFAYRAWWSYAQARSTLQHLNRQVIRLWQSANVVQRGVSLLVLAVLYFLMPVWVLSILVLQIILWMLNLRKPQGAVD